MKIVVASADTHTYGLNLVEGVLKWAGADVVNGGLAIEPVSYPHLDVYKRQVWRGIICG